MDLQEQSKPKHTYLLWLLGAVVVISLIFGFWLYYKNPVSYQPTLPANFPADIAIYPNSKLLTGIGVITSLNSEQLSVTYSSTDTIEQVVAYLVANSTSWSIKERATVAQPEQTGRQLDPALSADGGNRVLAGEQGNKRLMIAISNSENKVLIRYAVTLKK